MAAAIVFFCSNLLGLGFGPLITGVLSDRFTAVQGPAGLGTALLIALSPLAASGLALARAARTLEADVEP